MHAFNKRYALNKEVRLTTRVYGNTCTVHVGPAFCTGKAEHNIDNKKLTQMTKIHT